LFKTMKAASWLSASADLLPLREAIAAARTIPFRRATPPRRPRLAAEAELIVTAEPAVAAAVPIMMVASATDMATTAKVAANKGFMMMI